MSWGTTIRVLFSCALSHPIVAYLCWTTRVLRARPSFSRICTRIQGVTPGRLARQAAQGASICGVHLFAMFALFVNFFAIFV